MSLSYIKPGDWAVLGLAMMFTAWLAFILWHGDGADKAIVRSGGKVFREAALSRDQAIVVPGPLGTSTIVIHNRQVRVASDPSPRQYCVHQGWLKQAGEIAVCLPNQVSVELAGSARSYDSLTY